jgi:hypothetical protein
MTILLIAALVLCLSAVFGSIAALLLIPATLITEACQPGGPPTRRALPRKPQRTLAPAPTECSDA